MQYGSLQIDIKVIASEISYSVNTSRIALNLITSLQNIVDDRLRVST